MSLSLLGGCGGPAKNKQSVKSEGQESSSASEEDAPKTESEDQPVVKRAESEPAMLLYGGPPTQDGDEREDSRGPDDPAIGL